MMAPRRVSLSVIVFVCLLVLSKVNGAQTDDCPPPPCTWNYFLPSSWPTDCGGIWSLCGTGTHQSPIDIDTSTVVSDPNLAAHPLELKYSEVYHTKVVNLGTTIHVDVGSNNTVHGGPLPNETLVLNQLHFHAPGEHLINGAQSAAEVHMVHKSSSSNQTVVIVVRVQASMSTSNPWFDQIFLVRDLPVGANTTLDINPLQLFPESVLQSPHHLKHQNYYYYEGSLTTPPCTEGVHWIIFIDPIYASQKQINSLERWEGINNRPTQAYNGTVYKPHYSITTPSTDDKAEDIRYMGMVIGVSFILGLISFFAIVGIAVLALHLRDVHSKRDFYGAQQFEMNTRPTY